MSRTQVVLRSATELDAAFLADLWALNLRPATSELRLADLTSVIEQADRSPLQRLVIAEYDARPAGAVLLQIDTISSLNLEPTVRVISPTVAPAARRHGVGGALMEAAVAFAEERGIAMLATAVGAGARESNRFMARLAFSPLATYRVAPAAAVRARLRGQRPTPLAIGLNGRQVTRVVAARRSMRRSRTAG